MSITILKLWMASYIYNYILIIKTFVLFQYLVCIGTTYIYNYINNTFLYYDCILYNSIMSLLSSLVDATPYKPIMCEHFTTYLLVYRDNIKLLIYQIPYILTNNYLVPFKSIDHATWNEILQELV